VLLFPLRLKLSLLTSVLLIGTIGTVSVLVIDRFTEAIEVQARERVQFMAVNLAENARDAMLAQEELVLDQLLRSVAQQPGVVVARLVDKKGDVVSSSLLTERGRFGRLAVERPVAIAQQGETILVTARMRFSSVDIGEAQVELDLGSIIGPVVARTRRDIIVASGALLALGMLIAVTLSARITHPLRRLRVAVNALAAGDTSAQVPVTTRDEVADLTAAFNEMSRNLHEKKRVEIAFRRYVSDHVLREVLEAPEAVQLHGERREITVVFIDIRKFSRLTNTIGPERLVAYLNSALELITNRLLQHGATVDKYLGDAVLAYFGAPIEAPDHPQRAVACAIAIQRAVRERNLKLEATGQPFERLDVGIGIQTGEVVVGNIGSELKMDYTAIGDAVNVASRLQSLAGPGEILLTAEVHARVRDMVQVERLGWRNLDGREQPVDVYRASH
jgi:adenylate cyclase